MVVPEDQDGKSEDCPALGVQSADNADQESTRKGGAQTAAKVIPRVIVDMREFRSELPAILYTRGIKIEPVTLVVSGKRLHEVCQTYKYTYSLINY